MQLFLDITGGIWIVFWLYWLISALRTYAKTERRGGFPWPVGMVMLLAAVLVLSVSGRGVNGLLLSRFVPDIPVVAVAGIVFTAAGLLFAVWARVHLGRNWSGMPMIKVGHQLVRTGPYQYVRNPIYTGILVALIGTALVIGFWIAVLAVAAAFMAFIGKIRAEEKLLRETFGGEYEQYMRDVKALIPFVV